MYRPLDWFVVTISLLAWWTHRVSTDPAPAPGSEDSSPFAYVNEDGSLTPLTGILEQRDEPRFTSQAVVVRIVDDPVLLAPALVEHPLQQVQRLVLESGTCTQAKAGRPIVTDRRPAAPAEVDGQWLSEPVL